MLYDVRRHHCIYSYMSKYEKISHDIIAYTRICQNMKWYLYIYSYIRVYRIWRYMVVYACLWWYILLKQSIYRHIQCQNFDMKCLWIYITLHTCTYFDPMIRFQLHPPGWPAWKLRICCGHCSDSRHSSSSTPIMFIVRSPFSLCRSSGQAPASPG